jgi:hypothetical protein
MRRVLRGGFWKFVAPGLILALSVFWCTPVSADGAFCVKEDAFSISNAPGYCFAMSAFARWYFLEHQGAAPLRKHLDKKVQERIARELQTYYSKNLIHIQAEYCNRYHGNQTESFQRCVAGLATGEPRIVLLMNKGARGAVLHAVLAYEWVPDQSLLKVYDPNYPTSERFLDLERQEYTSLDITYHAICFPEVLHHHAGLIGKMQALFTTLVEKKVAGNSPAPAMQQRLTENRVPRAPSN